MVADHQGGEHQGGVTPRDAEHREERADDDKSMLRRQGTLKRSSAVACCCWPAMRVAQTSYPEQTVRILVGFPAGTAPDVAARIVADKFAQNWGKPVVVENITGASGNIAVDRAAKAPRDGYTLLMGGNSSLIMSVSLNDKLPFDPVKDFVADQPDLRRREPAGGASRRAGEEHRGAGRARARRSPAS